MIETLDNIKALIAPVIVIMLGMIALLLDLGRTTNARGHTLRRGWIAPLCLSGLVMAAIASFASLFSMSGSGLKMLAGGTIPTVNFGGGMISDGFSGVLGAVLCVVAALVLWMAAGFLDERRLPVGEFYALVLFSTSGAMIMLQSVDLVNVFVGLEVLSVALYILSGYLRRNLRSEESAVKYFLLGAFSSGFLLYGISLIYGSVGLAVANHGIVADRTSFTNFFTIGEAVSWTGSHLGSSPLFVSGVVLVLVGLGFKASLVPFHAYAPDVYQGAPAPVTAFMSAAAKIGALGALVRLLQPLSLAADHGFEPIRNILWGIALATMLVGNVLAVRQTNLKRMLAYSSIAHAGYLLVGVIATTSVTGFRFAVDAVVYYLLVYALMNVGAFAVIVWLGKDGRERAEIADFRGLGKTHPGAAATLSVLLLSLGGIPPTGGFLGKFYLFLAAVNSDLIWLAAIGLAISVIGVFYYLNLIVQMYFREPTAPKTAVRGGGPAMVAVLCAVAIVVLGIVSTGLVGPAVRLNNAAPVVAPDAAPVRPGVGQPNGPMPGSSGGPG